MSLDLLDFPILSTTTTPPSNPPPKVQDLLSSLTSKSSSSSSSSNESIFEPTQVSKHLVEVYFKEGVQLENEGTLYAAMKRDLSLGPFHPLFGPVPFDATIVKKIDSPFLETLLSHFKILASDYLIPPTTIEMPTILESFTKWQERYPHILYNVVFVARGEWKRRLKELDKSINCDKAIYTDWGKLNPVDQLLSEDDVGEWAEVAMYLQIEKLIHESYLLWSSYSKECLLSIEHEKMKVEENTLGNSIRAFNFYLIGEEWNPSIPRRPTVRELYRRANGVSSKLATIAKYVELPLYDQHNPPSTPSPLSSSHLSISSYEEGIEQVNAEVKIKV